jgi:N utilization substance protein B
MSMARQRREAVFAVYQHDATGRPLPELLPDEAPEYTRALAEAVLANTARLDRLIDRYAEGWRVDRIHPLERAILRVALQEMLAPPDTGKHSPIPPQGAIEEAVRTAKRYCEAGAPAFVNGILNAVLQNCAKIRERAKRE